MCGIAGFISERKDVSIEARTELLGEMCRSIYHRGPDEEGALVSGRAALGMRRLSIIDLKTGQQPIYSEDQNLAIVFNGEIYNFRELKKDLESRGHRFSTHSDTETIIHAYEEFGKACVEKLRGMFAFAIWNFRDEELFMARDRVGKKPLFFGFAKDGSFVFGSELKAVLAYGTVDKTVDPGALDAYITFGYVPEEFCIFRNVNKLAPGHHLTYSDGQMKIERYWDFKYDPPSDIRSEADYIEILRDKIREAVKVRLVSDVPLGAFLSGGIDSSTIVAMMSALTDRPVKTFSIGFEDDSFDELKFARVAAKHFGTEHHEFVVTPDLVETIDELVWHFDEPFADSSAIPTFMVSKMAREFVTVVLSGDGGDELFAGYSRYAIEQRRSKWGRLPKPFRAAVLGSLGKGLPRGAPGKNFLFNVSLDPLDRYIDNVSVFNSLRKRSLYTHGFREKLNGKFALAEHEYRNIGMAASTGNPVDRLLYLDSKTYLPSDILVKVDRMSMANSLEVRAPLLDHKLIEYVVNMPLEFKMKGLETKYILKKAMEGIVPNSILYRKKQGFGVPIKNWINVELRDRILDELTSLDAVRRGYFEKNYIVSILDEHARRRRDNSHLIWLLWMLELWHRRFVDGVLA